MNYKRTMERVVIFDDVGSYPLPEGFKRKWIEETFRNDPENKVLREIIQDAMLQKIRAGVEIPNYPQFQSMISQFITPITDARKAEEPFLIKESEAVIHEIKALEGVARRIEQEKKERLRIRVCVTGPVELYHNKVGRTVYEDVLLNIARSLDRFIKRSIEDALESGMEVAVVSIDEPSLGINPAISTDEDMIMKSLEVASRSASQRDVDVQVHLHSPIFYKVILDAEGISVISIETAELLSQPKSSLADMIDKKEFERRDKFLRIGIARTDFSKMATSSEGHVIEKFNSPEIIGLRLKKAYSIFGDVMKYVGPDCGLGTFPDQKTAFRLLENTSTGIRWACGDLNPRPHGL